MVGPLVVVDELGVDVPVVVAVGVQLGLTLQDAVQEPED